MFKVQLIHQSDIAIWFRRALTFELLYNYMYYRAILTQFVVKSYTEEGKYR